MRLLLFVDSQILNKNGTRELPRHGNVAKGRDLADGSSTVGKKPSK
jgi:hypothetical protein